MVLTLECPILSSYIFELIYLSYTMTFLKKYKNTEILKLKKKKTIFVNFFMFCIFFLVIEIVRDILIYVSVNSFIKLYVYFKNSVRKISRKVQSLQIKKSQKIKYFCNDICLN